MLIFILQEMANLLKRRHGFPARFHRTGAGHAMTAAVHGHQLGHSLQPTGTVLNITHEARFTH